MIVLRSSYKTKIWLIAHIPKPAIGSPLEHGCKDGKFGLEPILFAGPRIPIIIRLGVWIMHLIWSIAYGDIQGIK
jgi:hypothetical protein